ncbi:MAG: UbiX family flavin prenyltransferase [Nitrospinae bacterium]|nr:UbiX family flavin prenyltransferase [Nitrospinota bacterium]
MKKNKNIILAITGASGTAYGKRLFDYLRGEGYEIHLLISAQGEQILKAEADISLDYFQREGVVRYDNQNLNARVASGLFPCAGMAIVPASMGVIGRIASGTSSDLITRAADVALKEKSRLVLVPRETPVHRIHLRNMLALAEAGACILPASPGFYHRPRKVEDLVDFVVARILKMLDIENDLVPPWEPSTD